MEKANFRISMFAKVKAPNSSKNTELQCLERLKYRTPMFGKTNKIYNQSNVWNSQNSEFQCWKRQNPELICLDMAKHWNPMLGKAKFLNSNVCERQNTESQCLEKLKSKIPRFGKAKTLNSNVWKSQSIKLPMLKKKNNTHNLLERQNTEFQCLKSQNAELRCLEEPKHWIPFFNPLSPKSDQHEISHCNINANRVVMEITDMMITQDEFAWFFLNFSLLLL